MINKRSFSEKEIGKNVWPIFGWCVLSEYYLGQYLDLFYPLRFFSSNIWCVFPLSTIKGNIWISFTLCVPFGGKNWISTLRVLFGAIFGLSTIWVLYLGHNLDLFYLLRTIWGNIWILSTLWVPYVQSQQAIWKTLPCGECIMPRALAGQYWKPNRAANCTHLA